MVFVPPNFAYVIVFKNALANMQFSQLHLKTTVYASLLFMQNLKVKQGGAGGVMGDCVMKQCKKMSVYVCINTKGKVKRATKFCNMAAPKRVEQRCCAFLLQTTETNLVTLFVARPFESEW